MVIFHSYVTVYQRVCPVLDSCADVAVADNEIYLVGGIPTPLKNMKVNGKDDIPYRMEN